LQTYLSGHPEARHKAVGNLPYHITTPIIERLLAHAPGFVSLTLMVQREAADRIRRGDSPLSLTAQYHADITVAAYVPANCFHPCPNVDSAVLHFAVLKHPRVDAEPALLFKLIKKGYAHRRKTLLNNLSGFAGLIKQEWAEILPTHARAEELSLYDWAALTHKITQRGYEV
jgi:16S rRNA (adenine1518-N6/adenine1519-N6)-dimethyltransferase